MYTIAVLMNKNHEVVKFFDCDMLTIFIKDDDRWYIKKEYSFNKIEPSTPNKIRKDTSCLLKELNGCIAIAGNSLNGIAFSVFDMAGFNIFDISSVNDDVLNGILEDIQYGNEEQHIKQEIIKNAKPVETSEMGVYFLDLIMLQTECPEISSKKALKDFFANTPYMELQLICKHIPPWIENDTSLEIKHQFKQNEDTIYVVIQPHLCRN